MDTYIVKAVIMGEAGTRVQLYHVTTATGDDPLRVFGCHSIRPTVMSATVIATLSPTEAASYDFGPGDVRNILDA